ncbi:hypothetical protein C2R22_10375 [Salinigranum rubrum]|uniref:DUF8009 domain-containing protein n=1 Tax=Salinigranum rubrum TaxID=755307 RepID=A0A2I8VJB5_9EURY|nr:hypothetical protein [Salinigranum rubrum]AUV82005.1 hypothetical protein C2R22_10375 [Salinigranum rubrum]
MTTGFDRRRERGSDDPTTIRSLAVTVDDVVTALEAHQRADRPAVLRVTPPFAGRMRARLHVVDGEGRYDGGTAPLHIHPGAFVGPGVAPIPSVDDTEDELRRRGEYSVERHREFHRSAVDAWRESVREGLVDRLELDVDSERHTVEVKYLGRRSE